MKVRHLKRRLPRPITYTVRFYWKPYGEQDWRLHEQSVSRMTPPSGLIVGPLRQVMDACGCPVVATLPEVSAGGFSMHGAQMEA